MSATITLHCDHAHHRRRCDAQFATDAVDLADARYLARLLGWHWEFMTRTDACPLHAPADAPPLRP